MTIPVGSSAVTVPYMGVGIQTDVCDYPQTFFLKDDTGADVVDNLSALFSIDATGEIVIQPGTQGDSYLLEFILEAEDQRDNNEFHQAVFTFTVTYGDCSTTVMTAATPSDMTTSVSKVYDAATDLQTIIFTDTYSKAYGNADGTTLCGAREITAFSDYPAWLTVDTTANTFSIQSTDDADIGSHTVTFTQCLVDWATDVDCINSQFTVDITPWVPTASDCGGSEMIAATPSDMTTAVNQVYDAATDLQTIILTDTYSTTYGVQDGTTLCGDREITAHDSFGWLTVDTTANTFSIQSSDSADVGPHTVTFTQCLVAFNTVCIDSQFDVLISPSTDDCVNSVMTDATPSDMTVSALKTYDAATDIQTIIFADSYSENWGTKDGTTFCGAREITAHDSFGWLTVDTAANTFKVESTDFADIGTHTVTFTQCLVDQNSVCLASSFQVIITDCEVTSFTVTDLRDFAATVQIVITSPQSTYQMPIYDQVPNCQYTFTQSILVDGASAPAQGFSDPVSTDPDLLLAQNSVRVQSSHTIRAVLTLDACTVGLCSDDSVSQTFEWIDPCRSTVLQVETINDMTTQELSGSSSVQTITQFTDTVGDNLLDATYCGDRVYTIDNPGFLSVAGNTITLDSTDNQDNENGSPYTATVTCSLVDFPEVTSVTQTFQVTIDQCIVLSLTEQSVLSDQTQTIGSTTDTSVTIPDFVQSPLCGYTPSYEISYDGGAYYSTSNGLLDVTSQTTIDILATNDRTLSTSVKQIGLLVTLDDAASFQNNAVGFQLTYQDLCPTSTIVDPAVPDVVLALLETASAQFSAEDTIAQTYGTEDGQSLCGAKTYSFTYTKSGLVQAAAFITETGSLLSIAPTNSADQGVWTVDATICLQEYPTICFAEQMLIDVGACRVQTLTKSGSLSDINSYTSYTSGSITNNLPTYTQDPNCGYDLLFTIQTQAGGTKPSFITTNQVTEQYTILSNSLADEGVYDLELVVTLVSYPAAYTQLEESSQQWSVTVLNPCDTTTLANLPTLSTMTTTVKLGTTVWQKFTGPTDSISVSYDSVSSHYQYSAGIWYGPYVGSNLCGERSYSINTACQGFLTMTYDSGDSDKPGLSLMTDSDADISTHSCTITSTLVDYPSISKSKTVSIVINECVVNTLTLDTLTTQNTIQEYILMGDALDVAFPTFTQSPLCGYPIVYSLSTATTTSLTTRYPAGSSWTDSDVLSPTVGNLNNIQTFDTTNLNYQADIKANVAGITTLDSYQYQGDYAVTITGTTDGAAVEKSNSNFGFILRVTNPCKYSSFTSASVYTPNTQSTTTISQITTTVLIPASTTFDPFTDNASTTLTTADGYTMCGARSYTYSPTYSWLDLTGYTFTASPTVAADVGYSGVNGGCRTITVSSTLDLYSVVPAITQTLLICIEECIPTSFSLNSGVTAQTYTIFDTQQTISTNGYSQTPACDYAIGYTATIQKTGTNTAVSAAVEAAASALTQTSHTYVQFNTPAQSAATTSQFLAYSQSTPDSGVYEIILTAVLQEFKYLASFNTNSDEQFELTIIDPCASAIVNDFWATTSVYYRQVVDLVTSVKGPADSHYVYAFTDSVSKLHDSGTYAWDGINPPKESLTAGTTTCQGRTYTLGGDYTGSETWLQWDASSGLITASTQNDADINYSTNGGKGYEVTFQACLTLYPSQCSAEQTFYVKVQECIITNFYQNTAQLQMDQTIFADAITQDIVSYTQQPDCGWQLTYDGLVDGLDMMPDYPWLTLEQSPVALWSVYSDDADHSGSYIVTQIATLDNTIEGDPQNRQATGVFTIVLTDPCDVTTINTQSATGELFESALVDNQLPSITTSVLADEPLTWLFDIQSDSASDTYKVDGVAFVCGPREYNLTIAQQMDPSHAVENKTAFIAQQVISETESSVIAKTGDDGDIGLWKIEFDVQLVDYPTKILTQHFYVKIEYCIIKSFKKQGMTSSQTADLEEYQNPLTPFTYTIYNSGFSPMHVNRHYFEPLCNYTMKYKILLPQFDNIVATSENIGLLDNQGITSTLQFQELDNTSLDLCEYGVDDGFGNIDYTQCNEINPYYLNFVAYADDPNINNKSEVYSNNDTYFYVWPKDPCYQAELLQDVSINQNETIIYFLGSSELNVDFQITDDTINTSPVTQKSGTVRCGDKNYFVTRELSDDPGTVTFTSLTQTNPTLMTYSDNTANAGTNIQRVKSWMQDYPHVTAYSSFTVIVYQILTTQDISLKYYQISKPTMVLNIDPFVIAPANDAFTLSYEARVTAHDTGYIIEPTPEWLTFDPQSMQLSIMTRDFTTEGMYFVQIVGMAIDEVLNIEYETQAINQFELQITKDQPPINIVPAPVFIEPLNWQSLQWGQAMPAYTLPAMFDENSFTITREVTQKPSWLEYDEGSGTFEVLSQATTEAEIGSYVVKIELSNSGGASATYTFTVTVEAPIIDLFQEEESLSDSKSPVPSIKSITERGMLTIQWDKAIKIPRNLTFVQLSNTTYVDPDTFEINFVPGLYIEVFSGGITPPNDLKFTWYYRKWRSKSIDIQLVFEDPLLVSHEAELDWIKIIFYEEKLFVDSRYNVPVNGGPDPELGHVLNSTITPQIPITDPPVADALLSGAGSVVADLGQVIFQLALSYFLNNLWSMVSTQQIIVLIPLFKIDLPQNAGEFFNYLMKIAAFDIIPTDDIFEFVFQVEPPDPITENFGTVGFETTYFLFNLGSLVFALVSFPIFVIVSQILKRCYGFRSLVRRGVKIERDIYWNQTIDILATSYTILIVCACLQLTALDFSVWGAQVMSITAIFYFVICVIYPVFQVVFCWKNHHRLEDKAFRSKWKSMYDGKKTEEKGFIAYNFVFIARRFMLGVIVVYAKDVLFYQVSGLVFQTIIAVIVSGATNSFQEKRANKMEYFNEVMILMVMYNVMCFTDMQPDVEVQYFQGYVMIFAVLFHIGFNLSLVAFDNVWQLKMKWFRYRLMRKYAKTRGERNRKLQKQKRHERWQQETAKILEREIINGKIIKKVEEVKIDRNKSYEMAEDGNQQEDLSISSQELSAHGINQNDSQNQRLIARRPADAPEAITREVKEFTDGAGRAGENNLGRQMDKEFRKGFEKDVHKSLQKPVPLDPFFDDLQKVMEQDEPEEWKERGFKDRIVRRAPQDKEIEKSDPNSVIQIHNRLARKANVQSKAYRQVKPITKANRLRVQVDTKAVHERLFMKLDQGDGTKMNSQQLVEQKRSRKKKIVEPEEPFVNNNLIKVPKMREEMTAEELVESDLRELEYRKKSSNYGSQAERRSSDKNLVKDGNQLVMDDFEF